MLGQYTFGLREIKASEITDAVKYFGSEVGAKATASDAKAIDLKAEKQMYSLKARLCVHVLDEVLPSKSAGTKGVVTITPTVTTAGDAVLKLKVQGVEYSINLTATESDASKVVAKIKEAVKDDEKWVCSGTNTAIFTQKEAFAYTYAAADWAGTVTGTGSYSTSAAKTTDAVAPVEYGITYTLEHCETIDGVYSDLIQFKLMCPTMIAQNTQVFEVTIPSNCHRFVRLKQDAEVDATNGCVLIAIEPKN